MLDKTSFTGLQNFGLLPCVFGENNRLITRLAVQLNDCGSYKDLSDFRTVLKKFPDNLSNNTALKLDIIDNTDAPDTVDGALSLVFGKLLHRVLDGDQFVLNGKKLDMREDVSVFQKIFDLIKRVSVEREKAPLTDGLVERGDLLNQFFDNADKVTADRGYSTEFLFGNPNPYELDKILQTIDKAIVRFYNS